MKQNNKRGRPKIRLAPPPKPKPELTKEQFLNLPIKKRLEWLMRKN